jgi:hypothetical protein
VLNELGYTELVEEYEKVEKWYAYHPTPQLTRRVSEAKHGRVQVFVTLNLLERDV